PTCSMVASKMSSLCVKQGSMLPMPHIRSASTAGDQKLRAPPESPPATRWSRSCHWSVQASLRSRHERLRYMAVSGNHAGISRSVLEFFQQIVDLRRLKSRERFGTETFLPGSRFALYLAIRSMVTEYSCWFLASQAAA